MSRHPLTPRLTPPGYERRPMARNIKLTVECEYCGKEEVYEGDPDAV